MAEQVARRRPAPIASKGAHRARAEALPPPRERARSTSAAPQDVVKTSESDVPPVSGRHPCAGRTVALDANARSREIEIEPDPLGDLLLRWACEAELTLRARGEAPTHTHDDTARHDRDEASEGATSGTDGRLRIRDGRR